MLASYPSVALILEQHLDNYVNLCRGRAQDDLED